MQYDIVRVTSGWNESTVTWNTQPTLDATIVSSLTVSDSVNLVYRNWDITSLVQGWHTGASANHGLALLSRNINEPFNSASLYFASSDVAPVKVTRTLPDIQFRFAVLRLQRQRRGGVPSAADDPDQFGVSRPRTVVDRDAALRRTCGCSQVRPSPADLANFMLCGPRTPSGRTRLAGTPAGRRVASATASTHETVSECGPVTAAIETADQSAAVVHAAPCVTSRSTVRRIPWQVARN